MPTQVAVNKGRAGKRNRTQQQPYGPVAGGQNAGVKPYGPAANTGHAQNTWAVDANGNPYLDRLSEPKGWTPFAPGGLGIMARRTNVDPMFGHTSDMLMSFATSQPMKLLSLLPTIHPSVGFAMWSALRLMFPAEGFSIECHAMAPDKSGVTQPDDQSTKLLEDFWKSLPQEVGGLNGLATTLGIQALFTGLVCIEGVPGVTLKGLSRAWPVDSLSITFIRPGRNADLEPYQKQMYPNWGNIGQGGRPFWWGTTPGGQLAAPAGAPRGGTSWNGGGQANDNTPEQQAAMLLGMNYVHMDKNTFFWRAIDSDVDDPYGMAPYSACLSEVLADLALMQDLRDAVHNAAWPRTKVGVNLTELHRVAVEVHRITDPKLAAQWVMARFNETVDYVGDIRSDDNIVSDSSGDVQTLQPGSFLGLSDVLTFLRQRIVQSLKTLPTLLGISDGSATMNNTSIEWGIYAAGLESIRAIVCDVIIRLSNLHLRLCGRKAVAVAKYQPIRTNDELVDANTENVQLQNAQLHEKMGYKSHDEAGQKMTGHKPVKAPAAGMIEPLPPAPGGAAGGPAVGGKAKNPKDNSAAKASKKGGAGNAGRSAQKKGGTKSGGAGAGNSTKSGMDRESKQAMKKSGKAPGG